MTKKLCKICGNPVSHNRYFQCLDCFHKQGRLSGKAWVNKEYLYQKYVIEKVSTWALEKITGLNMHTIHSRLLRFGIKPRTRLEAAKLVSERCRSGIRKKGYTGKKVFKDGYPTTQVGWDNHGNVYRADHVIMAEKALGRPLGKNECVHHVNKCRADNRPENLLICDKKYHQWLHRRMEDLYVQEHFPVPPEALAVCYD